MFGHIMAPNSSRSPKFVHTSPIRATGKLAIYGRADPGLSAGTGESMGDF